MKSEYYISSSRKEMADATIYINGTEKDGTQGNSMPCNICARLINNAGIARVLFLDSNAKTIVLKTYDLPIVKA